MIYPIDKCPLCNNKLSSLVDTNSFILGGVNIYFCPNKPQIIEVVSSDMTHVRETRVYTGIINGYHYSNRVWKAGQIVEVIIGNYFLQHLPFTQITKIFFLPVEDKPPQLIVSIPILHLDYSKPKQLLQKIKRLVLLS